MLRVLMVLDDYAELMFLQTVLKKLGFDVDSIQNPRSLGDSILRMNPEVLLMTAYGKRVRGADITQSLRRTRGLPKVILLRPAGHPIDPIVPAEGWLESPVAALDSTNMIADLCALDKKALHDKFLKLHMPEIEHEKARILNLSMKPDAYVPRWDKGDQDPAHPGPGGGAEGETITGADAERGAGSEAGRGIRPGAQPETLANAPVSKPEGTIPGAPEAPPGVPTSSVSLAERRQRYARFLSEASPPPEHILATKEVQDQVRDLRKNEATDGSLEDLERQRREFVEKLFSKKG